MQVKTGSGTVVDGLQAGIRQRAGFIQVAMMALSILVLLFLALYNLTDYPLTWFDEGSHLHVPKTLVRFGVYGDYSSEGFRYYGPTIGVGPTVMLPIAAAFWLFGIDLLQARLVMALYLLASILVYFQLVRLLGGRRLAWTATILLVSSRGVALLSNGRQLLGEVPGLFFLVAALWLWFAAWERASWPRLALVGLLLGLAMVTKYQYLLFVAPTLVLAWLANLVYYRLTPQRTFVVPGVVAAACFGLWQLVLMLYLGPSTIGENLRLLREASAGAAFALSPQLMEESFKVLFSVPNYVGALFPALICGLFLALPRRKDAQQWGVLWILILANLGWYVIASVGWWRYAFLGLALGALFVARLFHALTDGFGVRWATLREDLRQGDLNVRTQALPWVMLLWLAAMTVVPLAQSLWEIVSPGFNAPQAMASYLNEHVSQDVLIETWEPEMGFLTNHNYHFPPAALLTQAVNQAFRNGPPVAEAYDFVQTEHPDFVLVGNFAHGVDLYPDGILAERYRLVTRIGGYELYGLVGE